MRIEHIALYVSDLDGTRDFFVKYFGAEYNKMYRNPKTGFCSYFLTFVGNTRLEIMTRPDITIRDDTLYMQGYHHLAFSVGNRAEVDRLTEKLNKGGYEIISAPRVTGDGYYESCIKGVEGIIIEITE